MGGGVFSSVIILAPADVVRLAELDSRNERGKIRLEPSLAKVIRRSVIAGDTIVIRTRTNTCGEENVRAKPFIACCKLELLIQKRPVLFSKIFNTVAHARNDWQRDKALESGDTVWSPFESSHVLTGTSVCNRTDFFISKGISLLNVSAVPLVKFSCIQEKLIIQK